MSLLTPASSSSSLEPFIHPERKRLDHASDTESFRKKPRNGEREITEKKVEELVISQHGLLMASLESDVHANESDRVLLEFADGEQSFYSVKFLKEQFDYFQNIFSDRWKVTDKVDLKDVDRSMFELMIELAVNKKNLFKLVSKDSFDNINLYEDLEGFIYFFSPTEKKHNIPSVLSDIKKNQLPYMKLSLAQRIAAAYERRPQQCMSSSACSDDPQQIPVPQAVTVAKSVILACATQPKGKGDRLLRSIGYLVEQKKIVKHKRAKKNLALMRLFIRTIRPKPRSASFKVKKDHLTNQIEHLFALEQTHKTEIASLREKLKSASVSMMMRSQLIAYVDDPENNADSEIRELALNASNILESYKENVYSVLKSTDADMERKDLLEYIIGPKAFLFDTYGIVVRTNIFNLHYRFISEQDHFKINPLRFALDNDSPYALEREIRKSVPSVADKIKFVVTEDVYTVPESEKPAVVALRKEILPALKFWALCNDEERNRVKQALIDFNNYGELGVAVKDFHIESITPQKIFGYIRDANFKFYINIGNFNIMLLEHNRWKSRSVIGQLYSPLTLFF